MSKKTQQTILYALVIFSLLQIVFSKCAYRVDQSGFPHKLHEGENQPHLVQNSNSCKQYNGKMGCCDENNDKQQSVSYIQINGVFGYQGGGCDHCAINLKRFWCQYACSPNQADFVQVEQGYFPVPDPQRPGKNLTVQKVKITVQAQTACDLYNSCKRISFVTSVSAMQSPAGFLTFQGHNAVDDSFQYIDVDFSYDNTKSIYFSDTSQDQQMKKLSPCNTKINGSEWHGFKFNQNCTCNTCQQSCDTSTGFVYTQPSVFQGFNWILVTVTYTVVGIIVALVTIRRNKNKQKDC